jgi:hypothetical protein
MAEPSDITGQILHELREEMRQGFAGLLQGISILQDDVAAIRADVARIDGTADRIDNNVRELNVAVASLTVSNRHLRADVSQILAESGDHESRIARIEQHLGITKS